MQWIAGEQDKGSSPGGVSRERLQAAWGKEGHAATSPSSLRFRCSATLCPCQLLLVALPDEGFPVTLAEEVL